MLYEIQLDNNASAAARNICTSLGEAIVVYRTCRHWFKRFQESDVLLEDYRRSGRPLQFDLEH